MIHKNVEFFVLDVQRRQTDYYIISCYILKINCQDFPIPQSIIVKLLDFSRPHWNATFQIGRLSPNPWTTHDDVIKWKHFPRYWPFVRGIHRSPVNSPHKGQWRGALMFSLICVWINNWVNNREAGDLRRYRAHYDVSVIWEPCIIRQPWRSHGWFGLVLNFVTSVIRNNLANVDKKSLTLYSKRRPSGDEMSRL